jgi:catechol 2,3-dioxygenase-like lactoylglutathione lyase family enzyme
MLGSGDLVGFIASTDLVRSSAFYGDVLGLERLDENPFASVFDANGTLLRVTLVDQVAPAQYTILGWSVVELEERIRILTDRGVVFERFPGMAQDSLGIWTSPSGDRVAWFKDPDGNVLSLSQAA